MSFRPPPYSFRLCLSAFAALAAAAVVPTFGQSAAAPPPTSASATTHPPNAAEQRALVDSLGLDEMQEALRLLRGNYVNPADTDDRAVARATLSGLLSRLENGAFLLPAHAPSAPAAGGAAAREEVPGEFRTEIFPNHIGYARVGELTRPHLGDLEKALRDCVSAKLPAVILDLRATSAVNVNGGGDYELAAEVARKFLAKGRPLFTLKKPTGGGGQDQLFTTNADPLFTGRLVVVTDGDTAGAAEVAAGVLQAEKRALIVGGPTAGEAVAYADFALGGNAGALLRVAVAQIVLAANNASIFPGGVKPDLPAVTERAEKIAMFRASNAPPPAASPNNGPPVAPVGQFVFEVERPHFNEAALVAGLNPELDAARDAQARRREGLPPPRPRPRDGALQRAVDLLTAVDMLETKP